jgi:hypothetical protein
MIVEVCDKSPKGDKSIPGVFVISTSLIPLLLLYRCRKLFSVGML